jgi:hypothetical protein
MRKQSIGAVLLGLGAVVASSGAAHATLIVNPVPSTTDFWTAESGQSIPTGTAGYVGGTLVATASAYTFTYGPSGLVAGATGHGDSTNVNEFWVGPNQATAEALGDVFCTQAIAGHCAASVLGASFTLNLAAGAISFGFSYDQNAGAHSLLNGQRDDANGAYLAQIGLGTTPNAGSGGVAYLGLSDNPYPTDHDFQDLTLRVTDVPEPTSAALLCSGLVSLAFAYRRKRRMPNRKS